MCLICNVISWVNLISVNKMKLAVADEEISSFAISIFDLKFCKNLYQYV